MEDRLTPLPVEFGFAAQQAQILENLWLMLARGGKLLYATCSVFDEENQAQVTSFLARHSDAVQLPFVLPQAYPQCNIQQTHGQLVPSAAHDGFFYALLQKN